MRGLRLRVAWVLVLLDGGLDTKSERCGVKDWIGLD